MLFKSTTLVGVLGLVLVSTSSTTANSPQISASIQSQSPASSLFVQYLTTLTLEKPSALHPLIADLISNPNPRLRAPLSRASELSTSYPSSHPVFTPLVTPSETYDLLEGRLNQSILLRGRGERESLRISLGVREASGVVEAMRRVWIEEGDEGECENWIKVGRDKVCNVKAFWRRVGEHQRRSDAVLDLNATSPASYSFDTFSPLSPSPELPLLILYASPTSGPTFTPLFSTLYTLSTSTPPRAAFAIRWKPSKKYDLGAPLVLSAFGAGLDIKKSDYLVIDDRLSGSSSPSSSPESHSKILPIPKGSLPDLALRAASSILSSSTPFRAFTHLTSFFPLLSPSLPPPSPSLGPEILSNQMSSPASSAPSFTINGLSLPLSFDPFALVRIMRRERKVVNDLQGLGKDVRTREAREWVVEGGSKGEGVAKDGSVGAERLGEVFDARGDAVRWWNDLERDTRYKTWSKSVQDLLRPVYPGQMNLVARNLNNVVLLLDLSQPSALLLVAENVRMYVSRGIPLRFGLVPLVGEHGSAAERVARVVGYLVDTVGRAGAMEFMGELAKSSGAAVDVDGLRSAYEAFVAFSKQDGVELLAFDEVMKEGEAQLVEARAYAKRLGVKSDPASKGVFFINGAFFVIDDDFTPTLQRTLGLHVQFLQQEVYLNRLTDSSDASSYFYDLPTTYPRRNPFIFPVPETNPLKIVNLVDALQGISPLFVHAGFVDGVSTEIMDENEEDQPAVATIYLVADLESSSGRTLAKNALELLDKTPLARLSFVHNPSSLDLVDSPHAFANLLYLLYGTSPRAEILPGDLLEWLALDFDTLASRTLDPENPLGRFLKSGAVGEAASKSEKLWSGVGEVVTRFGFAKGESGLVVNGRVVGPFEEGAFEEGDLKALLDYELAKRILPVVEAIGKSSFDLKALPRQKQSQLISLATSVISESYLPDTTAGLFGTGAVVRAREYLDLQGDHSSIIGEHADSAVFEIGVVVDPATELAQRWAPIIETLASLDNVHVRLYLNPSRHLDELPIKRFYQYSFKPSLEFDRKTGLEKQPQVVFEGIPEDVLLTFSMDLQRSWLAFPKSCIHDLDNIRLVDLPASSRATGVQAVFELESIIVEGHARDMPAGDPPRGLQLELLSGTSGEPATRVGTIVMSNLGYFQLKANPGLWRLAIREGRSAEVFMVESIGAQGWKSDEVARTGDSLAVTTLEGLTIYPRFRRHKGQETTELLETEGAVTKGEKPVGVVDRLKSIFPFFAPKTETTALAATAKRADINVFTVASGLLYERMAFLMIVSVLRNTNSTVKFWFIQNFLSPSFKAFIPHMAREYNFDYELVTYQWPHWLRAQKEKQRTIWGYKILFLDVLFPLELDRVIFIDSDLIVRADLQELVDLDLKGAPYAYAPMGNDREETKGFRFWDSGYWKEHLKGAPYHISALYVVDLDRFRQVAAGDRLRQQYQGLSADPNSLANLDQDLPNNMQASIPIYTLDKRWLWCETWCSDESLAEARALDLCNNPLTHEPKLARARRLFPEWTVYDDEVAALAQRVAKEGSEQEDDAIAAFSKKADELEQAVQQSVEKDEFVEAKKGEVVKEEQKEERVKDEL